MRATSPRRASARPAVTSAIAAATVAVYRAEPGPSGAAAALPAFPTDGPYAYKVEYLGITCGHMTLESRREDYQGRPAYHIIMTARNSKFFNKIYRVDGRIESWVDAATMTSLAYESDLTEKNERKTRRYLVDRDRGVVVEDRDGKVREFPFEGGAALDPMAYVYRGRVLAGHPGTTFSQSLLTDSGVVETVTQVVEFKRMSTFDGKKVLLRVQPITADGEMFSRRGEFSYWIDPGPQRTLFMLDFKLGFGRLVARLTGPAEGEVDRRAMSEEPDEDE